MPPSMNEDSIQDTMNEYLQKNEQLATALAVFNLSNEQYRCALEPLRRPEFFVTNSTNDAV
jgi:hypothetical protein